MLAALIPALTLASTAQAQDDHTPLPPEVAQAKAEIVAISLANTDRWGDPAVQAQLKVPAEVLARWFADNRPVDEVDLTLGSWRAIWYEDASLVTEPGPGIVADRENSYQVVREGFYVNVGNYALDLGLVQVPFVSMLVGDYDIIRPLTAGNAGAFGLNAIDLEFAESGTVGGRLPTGVSLTALADAFRAGSISYMPVPGPAGVTGELLNLYVDDDLRVAFGSNDTGSERGDGMYVLLRQDFASE